MGGEGKLLVSLHCHRHSTNEEGWRGLRLSRLNIATLGINLAPFDVVFLVCIQPERGFLGKKTLCLLAIYAALLFVSITSNQGQGHISLSLRFRGVLATSSLSHCRCPCRICCNTCALSSKDDAFVFFLIIMRAAFDPTHVLTQRIMHLN